MTRRTASRSASAYAGPPRPRRAPGRVRGGLGLGSGLRGGLGSRLGSLLGHRFGRLFGCRCRGGFGLRLRLGHRQGRGSGFGSDLGLHRHGFDDGFRHGFRGDRALGSGRLRGDGPGGCDGGCFDDLGGRGGLGHRFRGQGLRLRLRLGGRNLRYRSLHDGRGGRHGRFGHQRLDRRGLGHDGLRLYDGDGLGLRRGDLLGLRDRYRDRLRDRYRDRLWGGLRGGLRLRGLRGGGGFHGHGHPGRRHRRPGGCHGLGDRGRHRLRRPRRTGLRRDLAGLRGGRHGDGFGARDVQVLGAEGRRSGHLDRDRCHGDGRHRGRRGHGRAHRGGDGHGGRDRSGGRTPVGEGTYDAAGGLGHRRAHVQRPAGGRGRGDGRGRRRLGGRRRDHEAAEVERAGVAAAGLVRAGAVRGVGVGGVGEAGVGGLRVGGGCLGVLDVGRVAVGGFDGEDRRLRDDLRVAPRALAARHQQQFLVVLLGRVVHEVLEGVAALDGRGDGARVLDRSGNALLIHHARVVRETLARYLAGVSHAYPSPIGFASSIARPPTRPPGGFAVRAAVRRVRLPHALRDNQ